MPVPRCIAKPGSGLPEIAAHPNVVWGCRVQGRQTSGSTRVSNAPSLQTKSSRSMLPACQSRCAAKPGSCGISDQTHERVWGCRVRGILEAPAIDRVDDTTTLKRLDMPWTE